MYCILIVSKSIRTIDKFLGITSMGTFAFLINYSV